MKFAYVSFIKYYLKFFIVQTHMHVIVRLTIAVKGNRYHVNTRFLQQQFNRWYFKTNSEEFKYKHYLSDTP